MLNPLLTSNTPALLKASFCLYRLPGCIASLGPSKPISKTKGLIGLVHHLPCIGSAFFRLHGPSTSTALATCIQIALRSYFVGGSERPTASENPLSIPNILLAHDQVQLTGLAVDIPLMPAVLSCRCLSEPFGNWCFSTRLIS